MFELLLVLLGLVFIIVFFLLSRKKQKEVDLSNKLARLVEKKNYTEAIELGEKINVNEKSFSMLKLNLMAAYFHVGRIADAKHLLSSMKNKDFGSASWILEDWRKKINKL